MDQFTLPYGISERLKKMTPDALELTYNVIRYISAADDSLDLYDHFFLDSKSHESFDIRNHIHIGDLTPEQRVVIESSLKAFREANAAAASQQEA